MTRDPRTFGRKPLPIRPRRFGHESFSFFAMLAAGVCTAWAVMTYEAIAFGLAIVCYSLATMTLPEGY